MKKRMYNQIEPWKGVEEWMNRPFRDWFGKFGHSESLPSANIKETDEHYEIDLAVPGMDKGDFDIRIENGMLIVSAEQKTEQKEEKDNFVHQEFSYQSFQRTFSLPDGADAESIEARYDNGVLHIMIPRVEEEEKPIKKIEIH